ncbi:Methylglyoxal synthase, active site,Glycoside hydrolase family 31,Glycoside hydrolase superfamily [Cinara cedri]|uniref:Methylglyoxal synthase, active site,Glycoside hydrolase family 31,Glycoside hydrolase superfamily n=1 Tax=Cinara cedri TaxID=506608 RepID=A0A5E4NF65_9HEMI|nr:Methylglyoxal synthase, active site,Glycoside hydrolase family 31,Glycoside hydrolase superfamily [Cinara cedri]
MDNNAQPSPFRIGSSESSGNVSDDSSYSEDFAGEPAEYDPQLTPERARLNGYDSSETFSDILEDVVINHRIHHGGTLPRPVLPAMHANRRSSMTSTDSDKYGILDDTDLSVNSLTSVNSISSLLREKLLMNIQKISKNKEVQADYKLRAFIICLFVVIVCVIKFAHVYYDRHVLQKAYFKYTRFNKEDRFLRLFSVDGHEIAYGYLGSDLAERERAFDCLSKHRKPGAQCFEWMQKARLYLSHEERPEGLNCYTVEWFSLTDKYNPIDCYEDGEHYGHWYGGGKMLGMAWPVQLGKLEMSPFITGHVGRHRWGSVLGRYFINSKGVAITVHPNTPLHVSINEGGFNNRLCLKASHDDFAYRRTDGLPVLNYTICSARNMKTLHTALSEKMLWDGLKASDTEIINSLLTEPVWQLAPTKKELLNESTMVNYTEDIIALGFIKQGHVLLNEFWQAEMGDFSLDQKRFPTMKETINIIHRRGFRIVVTIQPFISTESRNFAAAVREGILVKEIGSEGDVPALTRYKTVQSAGVLDITNKKCGPWLQQQLKDLVEKYQFDAFYLDTGSAYDLPRHYLFRENLSNPDYYKSLFTQVVSDSVNVFAVSSAISRPPAPIFVSLLSLASTWDSLQVIIPTMLTYGIVGYPFLLPGPVGGDFQVGNVLSHALIPPDNTSNESLIVQALKECRQRGQNYNESRELVMRWMQLATFLPVIRYARLPSDCDPQVLQLTKNLTSLRQQIINPLLKRYVQEALETAVPLIRPLWMLDPSDPTCYIVKDEFSVGEEVIVAPILRPGTTEREVYLPAGVWKDGIEGSLRKGSRWIHNYKIPLTKIAYFIKMPNNTRF